MKRTISLTIALAVTALAACSRTDVDSRAAAPAAPSSAQAPSAPPNASQAQGTRTAPTAAVSPDALNDTVISSRIKAALLSDPGMTGSDVSVNTDRGVVSLTGAIKSQEQSAIASAHAQRQDGVMRVDNHLAVMPS